MAAKTADPEWKQKIIDSPTAGLAKKYGRKCPLRRGWDDMRLIVMMDGLRLKFSDAHLKRLLIATDGYQLIEGNYWGDTFWGVCEGIGENHLGILLMELRREFISEQI